MKAGWFETDITPVAVPGIPNGGRCVPPVEATRIRSRLKAQCIVLEDAAGRRAVLVSLDVVGVTPDWGVPLRAAIVSAVGCESPAVLLNASHTHSSGDTIWDYYGTTEPMPASVRDYLALVHRQTLACAQEAASRLRPAAMRRSRGRTAIAINRRQPTPAGVVHEPNLGGYVDDSLIVLELRCGSDAAHLVTAACHPVTVYGAWPGDICADFPTYFRDAMAAVGGVSHVQFAQGLAGDVRPRILMDAAHKRFRPAVEGEVEAVGRQLADEVRAALGQDGVPIDLDLAAAETFIPVAAGDPIRRDTLMENTKHANPVLRHHAQYWLDRLDRGGGYDAVLPWSAGVLRLDRDHAIVHMAGEPVGGWRPILEPLAPAASLAFWGYTQDYTTYLPTDAMLDEGGYEVDQSNLFQRFFPQRLAHGVDGTVSGSVADLLRRVAVV